MTDARETAERLIFESPDRGRTIFVRRAGDHSHRWRLETAGDAGPAAPRDRLGWGTVGGPDGKRG